MKKTYVGVEGTATARAMIVAVVTFRDGIYHNAIMDWTAYVGGSTARDTQVAMQEVAQYGDKISRGLAIFIFGEDTRWKFPDELYRE